MAATIAIARAEDGGARCKKQVTRLGSCNATGQANTWRTFTTCHVRADGSGFVKVIQDGVPIVSCDFGPERGE